MPCSRREKSQHPETFERNSMNIHKLLLITFVVIMPAAMGTAYAATEITLHKSQTCECCEKYVDYLRDNGFAVKALNESDMDAIEKRYGVSHVASCHTALV